MIKLSCLYLIKTREVRKKMTLGDLKLEVLKLLDEDEGLTSENVEQSEYDGKMLGAINRALRRLFDKGKLPLTTSLFTDGIVIKDTEQGIIFNGLSYGTSDTQVLNIPQYILDLLPLGIKGEIHAINNLGEANDILNKFELFMNELPTPKVNAKTLELQTSVDGIYYYGM